MRRIAIVGGGHAGLQLGIGLARHGYAVTLVTDRTAEAVRDGGVLSTQGMQHTALEHERALGLDLWDVEAPRHDYIEFHLSGPGGACEVHWRAGLPRHGNSVCQRIKIPRWMALFEAAGGAVEIGRADTAALDRLAAANDLVVVATGKGEVGRLFARDAARSPYTAPQRVLSLTYLADVVPTEPDQGVRFTAVPQVGEFFLMPGLTTTGPCEMMVIEGIPGGPFDCWAGLTPEAHLDRAKAILAAHAPWEAARCRDARLTDPGATLSGAFTPVVRRPVATLPSGRHVLGIADVVMLNDPLTGQGSNNASKFAHHYLHRILARGERPFDLAWMEETFEAYWAETARWVAEWSNFMLRPPTPLVQALLHAAEHRPDIADRFVQAFDQPKRFFPWLFDPAAAVAEFGEFGLPPE